MPTFAEIEPLSLSDRVINALKDAFFAGELKPGDAIVERELARQMKVGTPVVREALISLQGQGFVRRVTNTGTFVTQFTTDEVRQLYTLRVELELLALPVGKATGDGKRSQGAQPPDCESRGSRGERRSPPIPGARLCLSQALLGAFGKSLPGRDSGPSDGASLHLRRARQRRSPHRVDGPRAL